MAAVKQKKEKAAKQLAAAQSSTETAPTERKKSNGGVDGSIMALGQGRRDHEPVNGMYGTAFRRSTEGPGSRGSDATGTTIVPNSPIASNSPLATSSPLAQQPVILNEPRNRFARTASSGV